MHMQMIFLDESGYSWDWKKQIDEQPFYVLSAVCLPMSNIPTAYEKLREEVNDLNLPGQKKPLGRGFEIKARDIAQGTGWWRDHNDERNQVRDLFLSFPQRENGTAFVVVVNKEAHLSRYAFPDDPYLLAFQFIFERIEMYLKDCDNYGYCIYDQNERLEQDLQERANGLLTEGSRGIYYSPIWNDVFEFSLPIQRILELSFGDSINSIGLQVADFFSSLTNAYYKSGKPANCGWWNSLTESLHKKDERVLGVGLKEFP
jgi:hypothetical protein